MEIMRLARKDKARLARLAALQTADDSARARSCLDGAPPGDAARSRPTPPPTRRCAPPADRGCGRRRSASRSTPRARGAGDLHGARAARDRRADDGGWTFDVSRNYASRRQALAFQYVLDRLQVLNVIAWSRAARTIPSPPRGREGAGAAARPPRRESPMTDAIRTPDVLLDGLPGFAVGAAASAPGTGCGSPTSTRATAPPVVMLARRADLELPVAQGRRRRCSRPATA